MRRTRALWKLAILFAVGCYLLTIPAQDVIVKRRPEQYKGHGFDVASISGPTPVLIAALGGFRTVAADLLWLKVDQLWDGGSWYMIPSVLESVVQLDPHFVLAWQIYGWHLAYNLNAESMLLVDRRYWLEEGTKVLERGVVVNPRSFDMMFELAWTRYDRAHDLYQAANDFYAATKLPGAKAYASRLYYRPYEHMLDFKKLWPALEYARKQFPDDHAHQKIVSDSIKWWHEHQNDPQWQRYEIVRENTARKQRSRPYFLYKGNPYWNVCPVCGLPTEKDKPVCSTCGYKFPPEDVKPLPTH